MQPTLNRYRPRLALTLAAAALCVATLAARAPRAHAGDSMVTAGLAAMIAFPTVGLPGIVTAIHNGVSRDSLSDGWRNAGYVFGALNVVAGVALPALGLASSGSCNSSCVGLNLAWSIPPLINGALNLGFAAAGRSPSIETRLGKVTVVPISGVAAQNKPFGGLGLQLASF